MEKNNKENSLNENSDSSAFRLIIKLSAAMLIVFIILGLLHRLINPVELHLEDDEYIERVFTEVETEAWDSPSAGATLVGSFDAGAILYVIEESPEWVLVRPLDLSAPDNVWVDVNNITRFDPETYRQWQYEEERRRYQYE